MAQPKKDLPDENLAPTEREIASETIAPVYTPPAPRQKRFERTSSRSEAYTHRLPQVRSGICDFCGVIDPNVPSQYQYKLCPHYRGQQLMCTYCEEGKDPDEVIYHSIINVAESPDNPDVMIAWCNSYDCSRKHEARFKRA